MNCGAAVARRLTHLGYRLQQQGDYAAARPLYERALAIREQALGSTHPDTAHSLNNLALLLVAAGEWQAAHPLAERALGICMEALGPAHPTTQRVRANLAVIETLLGGAG